ncbi:MAG TPA: antibiotic biosynthesis monooxygenase [Aliidongia sp.]|uniref:antibiotic biosynthesis monooxygenase family protein n=1 Tax=Aliidongia sp. TaxID=1914230 RepID=UPI002DDCA6BB|nr:antibiotic biosynthesis monooxygenase [Aliidongia sp.]HEV2673438.1 antibiotic biosynthesis monooxygenase [Aliidongia sp.]
MIARIWSTKVSPAQLDDYEAFAEKISLPMFRKQPGCEGVLMFRDGGSCHVLTLWQSQSDIDALATSPSYAETVGRIVSAGFLTGDQATRTYETHLLWVARAEEEAAGT